MRAPVLLCLAVFVFAAVACGGPPKPRNAGLPDDAQLEGSLGGAAGCAAPGPCQEACDAGDAKACVKGAVLNLEGSPANGEAAETLFLRACDLGVADGCTWAGMMRRDGLGVPADPAVAGERLTRACEGGDGLGCMLLGNMVGGGELGAVDHARAAGLFERACGAGEAEGCFNAGWYYDAGQGVAKDPNEAAQLFRDACNGGSAKGCVARATMLQRHGQGQDLREAALTWVQACDLPDNKEGLGCLQAGFAFGRGRGVDKDLVMAERYLKRGCDAGDDKACRALGGQQP